MTFKTDGLATTGTRKVEPNPDGMTDVFSRIGYSLGEAIADVIDNSIDAGARTVVLQLHCQDSEIRRITIADDGCGMTATRLDEIMQFGVHVERETSRLGKYGIGLKTASFSQCDVFTVVSKVENRCSARRWSLESAKEDWKLELIDDGQAAKFWKRDWTPIAPAARSGTIVVWDSLRRLISEKNGFESAIAKLRLGLSIELGMRFHRFIESDKLKLYIREQSDQGRGVSEAIKALNPFDYGKSSGKKGYPISFPVRLPGYPELGVEAHIWPPKSAHANYKLGSGAVLKRQGFYFYRNDRLIQAGGWHGYKSEEAHFSLARLRVDLPPEFDSAFQLTVQKNGCNPPPQFLEGLKEAKVGNTSFPGYLEAAQDAYRNAPSVSDEVAFPAGGGLPKSIGAALRRHIKSQNEGAPLRKVSFVWKRLEARRVIQVDLPASQVLVNTTYRTKLFGGRVGAKSMAPFLTLLFVALRDILVYDRAGKRVKVRERELNEMLLRVVETD